MIQINLFSHCYFYGLQLPDTASADANILLPELVKSTDKHI